MTIHEDRPGIVSAVSSILAGIGVNIASMRVFRQKKGGQAAMAIEVDQHTGESILPLVSRQPGVEIARLIDSIA
jgi:L-serine dehydratase